MKPTRVESSKVLVILVLCLTAFFTWTAFEAADRVEASWKSHDARLQAAIREAEGS